MLTTPFGTISVMLDGVLDNLSIEGGPDSGDDDVQTWFAADPTITGASL